LDVLCSNLSSQIQGEENSAAVAANAEQEEGDENPEISE
jgi:hypothetical protein